MRRRVRPCIPGRPTWSLLRPRPNNVNDKADKAATMQPTSCYVTLTTSGEACRIKIRTEIQFVMDLCLAHDAMRSNFLLEYAHLIEGNH